jgi:hypothetical protein
MDLRRCGATAPTGFANLFSGWLKSGGDRIFDDSQQRHFIGYEFSKTGRNFHARTKAKPATLEAATA